MDKSGMQNKYFKGISYLKLSNLQRHSLTLRIFLYLVILKKFQFSLSFLPHLNLDLYADQL